MCTYTHIIMVTRVLDDCFYYFTKKSSTLEVGSICSQLAGFEVSAWLTSFFGYFI